MHLIALTAAGVTVLIDTTDGRLPALAYWGRALPALDAEQAEALAATAEPVAGTNDPDIRPRVALLPGHDTGWTGRPGLRGSHAGAGWSPAFLVTAVTVDDVPASAFHAGGPGRGGGPAVDDAGRLELRLRPGPPPARPLRGPAAGPHPP